jgi:polyisoprenyl-phosphate glycosyltransferase
MSIKPKLDLSVVLPAYNEGLGIEKTLDTLFDALQTTNFQYEVIVVNDGSTDDTLDYLKKIKLKNKKLRIISSDQNLGHSEAINQGLRHSLGRMVSTMDADLQHPPTELLKMIYLLDRNPTFDVVQGVRKSNYKERWHKKIFSRLYYQIISKITGVNIVPNTPDFRVMSARVVSVINLLPEKQKVLRLLLPHLGFKISYFKYDQAERTTGKSSFSLIRQIDLGTSSIFAFSAKPLRYVTLLGLGTSFLCLIGALGAVLTKAFFSTVPGWTSLVLIILGLNSLLFGAFGLLGEYVGRIYELVLNRPEKPMQEL